MKCSICGRSISYSGSPLYWTVDIDRRGITVGIVKCKDGLMIQLPSVIVDKPVGPEFWCASIKIAPFSEVMKDIEQKDGSCDPVIISVCKFCCG